ncbi:MAG: cyclopropane-fatty-acyl-phospholipid synthase family protein [Gammaproteobacteria bacterium]|nr:cyclopropane-fatty-acyl-phospholipid synthase family protein [Gammaproteobacteria bacterium]
MIGEYVLRPLRIRPFATPAMHLLAAYLRRIKIGRLHLQFDGWTARTFGDTDIPEATLVVHRPSALLKRLVLRGDVGFAEGYMAGDWQTSDLTVLLRLLACNERSLEAPLSSSPTHWINRLGNRLRHRLRANNRAGSRRNIHAHYDLGNDFYRLWLDASMSYSAALFTDVRKATFDDLADAQQRKYERMLNLLDAKPGEHILEIGCGWGGFALAAARRGLRVTGITLSEEQLTYANRQVTAAGLEDRIELRLQDYRDLHETFDHVVSIEMMEAVGEAYWDNYFATLKRCVRPGGRIALQVITIDEARFEHYRSTPDFIQLHIFPGGMLPTQTIMQTLSTKAGLDWRDSARFGQHYGKTCALWNAKCTEQRSAIRDQGFDDAFLRRWQYYLSYCQTGFEIGAIDLVQVVLERPV